MPVTLPQGERLIGIAHFAESVIWNPTIRERTSAALQATLTDPSDIYEKVALIVEYGTIADASTIIGANQRDGLAYALHHVHEIAQQYVEKSLLI